MEATKFVELAQIGAQEPRNILNVTPGIYAANPSELAGLIAAYQSNRPVASFPNSLDANSISRIAQDFHVKAGTLTDAVLQNIKQFSSGAPILRVVHQATTFAYLGVIGQFIFLDAVAQNYSLNQSSFPCQVYLILDHDIADERRFRTSHFPSIHRRGGFLPLSTSVHSNDFDKVNWAIEKPTKRTIEQWYTSLRNTVKEDLGVLRHGGIHEKEAGQMEERLRMTEIEVMEAYNRSSNLSEFNAIFLSRIINLHWKLPTIFLSSSQMCSALKEHLEFLLQRYPILFKYANEAVNLLQSNGVAISNTMRPQVGVFPLWYICPNCSTRVSLKLLSETHLLVIGNCTKCDFTYQFDLGTYSNPDLSPIHHNMAARFLFNDLLDLVALGISGGVGYIGNAEHALISAFVAYKMNWSIPPERLWRPVGIYYGPTECRAANVLSHGKENMFDENLEKALWQILSGRASSLYYLISQGFDGLYQNWKEFLEKEKQMNNVNICTSAFNISEDQSILLKDKMYSLQNAKS